MSDQPRVTFGIIVLNGQPFVRYNLRALYPFAHQIIVVEGATEAAGAVATAEGHSTDGTLQALYRFKEEEDPDNKLEIVTREGFWTEKDEQSEAYARRATGDYLWQVDVDEFYQPEAMQRVLQMLRDDPSISGMTVPYITFWGGFDYRVDGWYLRMGSDRVPRIFKWGPGYRYEKHRPPTVLNDQGINLRTLNWLEGKVLERQGIFFYHYSLVFPRQVREKSEYYGQAEWSRRRRSQEWAEQVFGQLSQPYRVHNVYHYPSWLEPFSGTHPAAVQALQEDLSNGQLSEPLRKTTDINNLLHSRRYQVGRLFLQGVLPVAKPILLLWRRLRPFAPRGIQQRVGAR